MRTFCGDRRGRTVGFRGQRAGEIAISDDGQFLYVALDGAAAVRRVSLATLTADLQFGLGADQFFGPFYVDDIAVLPGSPHSVAVSRRNVGFSPRHEGVAIYDSGVQRPTTTPRSAACIPWWSPTRRGGGRAPGIS